MQTQSLALRLQPKARRMQSVLALTHQLFRNLQSLPDSKPAAVRLCCSSRSRARQATVSGAALLKPLSQRNRIRCLKAVLCPVLLYGLQPSYQLQTCGMHSSQRMGSTIGGTSALQLRMRSRQKHLHRDSSLHLQLRLQYHICCPGHLLRAQTRTMALHCFL
jgi:hypothetical protein